MGLNIAIFLFLLLSACVSRSEIGPADRASNQTFYYECCNPGLSAADKVLCGYAEKDEDHTRWDTDGNRYVYIWSDCKIGEEPWRKYK